METFVKKSESYVDFCDKMRNPDMMTDSPTYHPIIYPFNMEMVKIMVLDENPFFHMYSDYKFGENTVCAYLAYKSCTDDEFTLVVMAQTLKDYNRIMNKVYYFIKKSRFSLITKMLGFSRMRMKTSLSDAKYLYIAQFEEVYKEDGNYFYGWVHPKLEENYKEDNRPFTYGVHNVTSRMSDKRKHTIFTGKDYCDILKKQLGKYILYFNVVDACLDSCKENTPTKTAGEYFKNKESK